MQNMRQDKNVKYIKMHYVPSAFLQNIQLRVTVAEYNSEGGQARSVGHVIVGTQATGKALSHWNQMMSALRKPIGMWHPLRR